VGVIAAKGTDNTLYELEDPQLPPGEYEIASRTALLPLEDLLTTIDDCVEELRQHRSLNPEGVDAVYLETLLLFNFSSLQHEGNSLSKDDTDLIATILSQDNPADSETPNASAPMKRDIKSVCGSPHEKKEAVNHFSVAAKL